MRIMLKELYLHNKFTIMKKTVKLIILLILFSTFYITTSLRNPAAVYCVALGYEYVIEKTAEGEIGYCILPNGKRVDEWNFFTGREGIEFSYCKKIGLEAERVRNLTDCYITEECIMCIFPNGTKINVIKLMNLSFEETFCGDNVCGFPENYFTCPQDCSSGSFDKVCDGIEDNKCDPDCILFNQIEKDLDCLRKKERICLNIKDGICEENCLEDPDCIFKIPKLTYKFFIIVLAVVSTFLTFLYFYRKKKLLKTK